MQLGEMPPPYWTDPNGKLCVKNHTVTVSHLKSLSICCFCWNLSMCKKISIIAQFSLNILQIWYWELRLEGPGVPDHTHMNELNQIDLCIPNYMQKKKFNFIPKFILINFIPRYIQTCCLNHFGPIWPQPLEIIE